MVPIVLLTSASKTIVFVFVFFLHTFGFLFFSRRYRRIAFTRNRLIPTYRKVSVIEKHPEALSEKHAETFIFIVNC